MRIVLHSVWVGAAALAASGGLAAADPGEGGRSLVEFTDQAEVERLEWRVVNDGVMGGLSQGRISVSEPGTLVFEGTLSLENNGGFSSVRTGDLNLDLSSQTGVAMRVKGDGRTYQVRLGSDARYRGMEVSFQAEFPTVEGKWTEVQLPFDQFTGSWRGRMLEDKVLNTSSIQRLGLLLADKKAGPFSLEVDWIRAYSGSGERTIVDLAVADGRFKTLAAALQAADLVSVLQGEGPFTVFAPTDEAFSKLPEGTVESLLQPGNRDQLQAVLKYHVLPGATTLAGALEARSAATVQGEPLTISFNDGRVQVNDAPLRNADLKGANGIIHVIDSVLLPPNPEAANDIVGVARRAGTFKTLLAAVEAAGLLEALQGEGPLTVLAPTDEAFAALPEGTVENLLKEENRDQLKAILAYHAFAGTISAGDALNAREAESLSGQSVAFGVQEGRLKANDANIIKTDIKCDNGTIHVIDAVLLPPQESSGEENASTEKPADPLTMITNAIDRGVPAFNSGHVEECAAIYRQCLEQLAGNETIDSRMRKALQMVLDRAGSSHSDRDRAWIYRHALDGMYHVLATRG